MSARQRLDHSRADLWGSVHMRAERIALLAAACSVALIGGACRKASPAADQGGTAATAAARVGAAGEKYPDPRWPSYFKTPKSVDDLMPAARLLVRNQSGLQGKGMGILVAGDKVLIVAA